MDWSVPMNVIALDLATTTGWALRYGALLDSGVWQLKSPKELGPVRYVRIWNHLTEICGVYGAPDFVVYEQPGQLKGAARKVLPALQGVVELWCQLKEVRFASLTVMSIKKHATGNGRASKDDMVSAAKKKWPNEILKTDDQADALWLLDLFVERISREEDVYA
jgi:Holliday junction resolvasome RuvABC endonuclease subunit